MTEVAVFQVDLSNLIELGWLQVDARPAAAHVASQLRSSDETNSDAPTASSGAVSRQSTPSVWAALAWLNTQYLAIKCCELRVLS